MTALIAGVGNVFFGDDAFGVEVARRLAEAPPPDTRVTDFGIRTRHLAYELLEPCELCVVADCMPRGGAPGTLYVLEPDLANLPSAPGAHGAHNLDLVSVFAAVRALGGRLPPMVLVGCEPGSVDPRIGLSPHVVRAIPEALVLIRELVTSRRSAHAREVP